MEDISVQILAQTSENIQKLFDLSIRIDERVKLIQANQDDFDHRIENIIKEENEIFRRLILLESKNGSAIKEVVASLSDELGKQKDKLAEIERRFTGTDSASDKRLSALEISNRGSDNRWEKITSFVIQLVWIVLAAWVLTHLNLNPPPVP